MPLTFATVVVPLASLPEGQLLDQTWSERPAALPAGGHIAGVKLHREKTSYGAPGQTILEIAEADDDLAKADDRAPRPESLCFDTARFDSRSGAAHRVTRGRATKLTVTTQDDDEPKAHWSGGMTTRTQLLRQRDSQGRAALDDRRAAAAHRAARHHGAGPALESRDFWVDVDSGGSRLRATARLPLRDLGERSIGLHLFAARAGGEVVFVAGQSPSSRNLFAMRKDEGAQMTNCGHLSVRLDVKRGMSEVAAFETMLTLPEPVNAESEAKAKTDHAQVDDAEDFRNGKARAATPATSVQPPTTRTRVGRIFFDTSWEPNEAAPLLSFSESWGNRAHDE